MLSGTMLLQWLSGQNRSQCKVKNQKEEKPVIFPVHNSKMSRLALLRYIDKNQVKGQESILLL